MDYSDKLRELVEGKISELDIATNVPTEVLAEAVHSILRLRANETTWFVGRREQGTVTFGGQTYENPAEAAQALADQINREVSYKHVHLIAQKEGWDKIDLCCYRLDTAHNDPTSLDGHYCVRFDDVAMSLLLLQVCSGDARLDYRPRESKEGTVFPR